MELQEIIKGMDPETAIKGMEPFLRLLMMYECANMEIETKLNVLNAEFSLSYNRNPFESIKSRVKSPQSIFKKAMKKGIPLDAQSIEEAMHDVAGIRVICSFPEDIYIVREMLLKQDDITLVKEKDYISQPKKNGYRSLHLIVEVPIFLSNERRPMKVEIQIRTIAMDAWASLEHKLKYKQDLKNGEAIAKKLKKCADMSTELDYAMQEIRREIDNGDLRTETHAEGDDNDTL